MANQRRSSLSPAVHHPQRRAGPNAALEATGHSARFLLGERLWVWPAPQLERWAACVEPDLSCFA